LGTLPFLGWDSKELEGNPIKFDNKFRHHATHLKTENIDNLNVAMGGHGNRDNPR